MATETDQEARASAIGQLRTDQSTGERVLLWVDDHLKWLMTLPAVLILFSLTFYPLLRALQISTLQYLPTGTTFVGIENYANLLDSEAFLNSLVVTAKFVGVSVGIEFILGFSIALLLNRKLKLRGLWQTLILIPMILSPTVIGLIWRLMYAPNGLLDYIAAPFTGGANVGWISETGTALYSVILTDIWQWTPFVVLVLFAGLQSVPDDIREAAIMDGASTRQRFLDITLPYLKSLIVLVLIIRLVDALRVFAKVYVLTRGGPSSATNVISMQMYRTAFRFNNFGEASAMAVSLLVLVMVLAMSFMKIANVEFGS
ncbi:binding-protein-dependent transporters inner membrane component [Halogeometricum pallidum JCM 14848]|uniref:Binding-protein-dependent transporters inner membrane component n=1 Tax=Halogeometricum pallidum JCM 14848 TaxID=1227487 RepID=M0CXM9_HALPD|nr:sugar ABC transporter permease [Halogeometricum pallidum]ELZ27976.1 binding-protein-dependent transporters inner membrane component [Halogeometricum pallidum JCM 14848]